LWINTLGFVLVQSTQRFAYVWLVLDLGAKSDVSGLLLFVMGVPALFISLPVGVFSDRINRRRLLFISQIGAFVTTLCTALYITTGHITIASSIISAAVLGVFIAIGQPVRTAAVSTLVPTQHLMNAIIVSTVASNLALILGPAAAGPAISRWGIEGAFWVQAALYGVGLVVLFPLRLPISVPSGQDRHLMNEITAGARFIWTSKNIRILFILLTGSVVFMMAPWMVLGPQFVREQVGATGGQATFLYALLGVGQFCTSMWLLRNSYRIKQKVLWNQSMIQRNTPPEVMGRVMSVHSLLMVGLAPMASLAVGYMARHFDAVPATISISAGLMLILILIMMVTQHDFRSTP